jgi:hypothetical protein
VTRCSQARHWVGLAGELCGRNVPLIKIYKGQFSKLHIAAVRG